MSIAPVRITTVQTTCSLCDAALKAVSDTLQTKHAKDGWWQDTLRSMYSLLLKGHHVHTQVTTTRTVEEESI